MLLVVLVTSFLVQSAKQPHMRELLSVSYWRGLFRVGSALRIVHRYYVEEDRVGYNRLVHAALEGMLKSLDQFSAYMPKRELESFEEITSQKYVGIGIEIERIGSRITVVTPFESGPALEAGVLPGDQIVEVDGKNTEDFSLREITAVLRGGEGTQVGVKVYRPGQDSYLKMEIWRRSVDLVSVRNAVLDDEGIGYLRINNFGAETPSEFVETLFQLESLGMKGLIIDLRNNRGGLLTAAVEVAGQFFDRGEIIVSTKGRTPSQNREYHSETARRERSYPIAILVNTVSASSAEIVAASLQDVGRALIVGETTRGKGSVQSVFTLRNGDGLRETTAMYFTPSGRTIDQKGVAPDIEIVLERYEYTKLRHQRRHSGYLGKEAFRREFGFDPIIDRQREASIDAIRAVLAVDSLLLRI